MALLIVLGTLSAMDGKRDTLVVIVDGKDNSSSSLTLGSCFSDFGGVFFIFGVGFADDLLGVAFPDDLLGVFTLFLGEKWSVMFLSRSSVFILFPDIAMMKSSSVRLFLDDMEAASVVFSGGLAAASGVSFFGRARIGELPCKLFLLSQRYC